MLHSGQSPTGPTIRLRPVVADDLVMFRRFATEPGLVGLDWTGFTDAGAGARRFGEDGFLGATGGRLMVEVTPPDAPPDVAPDVAAGFVSWVERDFGGPSKHWEIGIALLPEWRGQGIGWRAQAMLSEYLFTHTTHQRIQAGTHPENIAEQRSLVKAGFQLEGVVRACEFRDGRWCDGYLYSRIRTDPAPGVRSGAGAADPLS